ncbi:hypothetical protein ACJ73_02206 [Blastomyces percursus]|uniref:Uncharacterized protein n=1 Tax=Blastomyces percursus TaxID=1658174 RepID=A0A1J9RCY7_9EURO|nr:hypothetical protein ACJ73_02206 [Blastomyces percursus]
MSTHNIEQIRSALHILSTAPEDIIRAVRNEVLIVFIDLRKKLQIPREKTIEALDKLLEKKEKIKGLLEMRASKRVNLSNSLPDIRFHHIAAVEPRQKTDESIIRALFAHRSVCDEFEEYELKTRCTSRVRELSVNLINAEKKNNGLITKYLQDKGLSNNLTGAIKTSIKIRVAEEWFGGAGVSLLFMNIYTIFRELRYSDLRDVITLLSSPDGMYSSVADLGRSCSNYVEEGQSYYDDIINPKPTASDEISVPNGTTANSQERMEPAMGLHPLRTGSRSTGLFSHPGPFDKTERRRGGQASKRQRPLSSDSNGHPLQRPLARSHMPFSDSASRDAAASYSMRDGTFVSRDDTQPYPPAGGNGGPLRRAEDANYTDWHRTVMNPSTTTRAEAPYISKCPLPVLLCSLGGSQVLERVLYRGLVPQKRWNGSGNVHEILLHDSGLDKTIVDLFSSPARLKQAVESCTQLGLTTRCMRNGSPVYSVCEGLRLKISVSIGCGRLEKIGLMFTTHIYPRDEILDPLFYDDGKLLLPYLEFAWQYIQEARELTLSNEARDSLMESSLAACRLVHPSHASEIISLLEKIQGSNLPGYLQMAIVAQRSTALRYLGSHDKSDDVINDVLEKMSPESNDVRSHCSYGRLLLSRAENSLLRNEFKEAALQLTSWMIRSHPSGLELKVARLKNTALGRVLRYNGDFAGAHRYLKECLKMVNGSARYHIMHHLADVYCELNKAEEAENLVVDEVSRLRADGKQCSKRFRRLALPLAEAYIKQGRLEAARSVLQELLEIFKLLVGARLDVTDQLGHVRSIISLARVSWHENRWVEALQSLETALSLTGKYDTFLDGNFYSGVISLFLSLVKYNIGDPRALEIFASTEDIVKKQAKRHFMPGVGTYFLEQLRSSGHGFLALPRATLVL